jgi:hypothetical protein
VEIDLNPVIAGPDGAVAVDALVVVEAATATATRTAATPNAATPAVDDVSGGH